MLSAEEREILKQKIDEAKRKSTGRILSESAKRVARAGGPEAYRKYQREYHRRHRASSPNFVYDGKYSTCMTCGKRAKSKANLRWRHEPWCPELEQERK